MLRLDLFLFIFGPWLQPVLTLGWAWLLLGERVTAGAILAAVAVAGFVWLSRRATVTR